MCVGDCDNYGYKDVYITAIGPNVLWHNTGHGTFTATGEAADPRWSTGCAFGDYDRDGLLDLYVANYVQFDARTGPPSRVSGACHYLNITTFCGPRPLVGEADVLYRNTGNGHFTDVSRAAGIVDPGYYGFGVLFMDLDDDGWPDIFVANDSVPNLFFRNLGNGTFAEQGVLSGLAVSGSGREQAGMGVDAGDLAGTGRMDLVKTNFSQDYTTIFNNEGMASFGRQQPGRRARHARAAHGMGRRPGRYRQRRAARSVRGQRARLSGRDQDRDEHYAQKATCS